MAKNIKIAREDSWDEKLKQNGSSWDSLDQQYKLPLTSLAYNVGGKGASRGFSKVLVAAVNKDPVKFAKELRRVDAGFNTKGMDNRVMKELFGAGFIKDSSTYEQFKSVLPLATWKP